jgi:nicotinate phosphoribosyltransferase
MPVIKVSENVEKIPNPGNKKVWRLYDHRGMATVDLLSLADEDLEKMESIILRHPTIASKRRVLARRRISELQPLLVEILRKGKLVYDLPGIEDIRKIRQHDTEKLDPGVKRLLNPHISHVSITEQLWQLKQKLINSVI